MAFSDALIQQARAVAARYVGNAAATAAAVQDPMAALERLANASSKVWHTRNLLLDLRARGLLMTADVKTFDVMRGNLYAAEMAMYTGLTVGLARAGVSQQTLASFPRPVQVPALNAPATTLRPGSVALQGVARRRGLGQPAAAAAAPVAAAATPTILIWAMAIMALLVALALVAAVVGVVLAADQIAAVFVVEAQTEQLRVFYDARIAFYTGCLSAGSAPAECVRLATNAVPTPIAALPKPPGGFDGWVWAAAGAGVIAVVGLVTYLVRGSGGNRMYRLR